LDGATVVESLDMSESSPTDPESSLVTTAGVDPSTLPYTTQQDSTTLGDVINGALKDVGEHIIIDTAVDMAAEYVVAEGLVTSVVGVAAVTYAAPAISIGLAIYGGYEAYEDIKSYVQSGNAAQDYAVVKSWSSNKASQIMSVFTPSSSTSGQSIEPEYFATNVVPTFVTRNISFVFKYAYDWRNLTTNYTNSGTISSHPIINPSPDGLLVGVKDNGVLISSYVIRLAWRPLNTYALNSTNASIHLPRLRFNHTGANWTTHVAIFSPQALPTVESTGSKVLCMKAWIVLHLTVLSLLMK